MSKKLQRTPLFDNIHNPNKDIFVIPTQEGADEEDQWNGSIGDATMEHIYQNNHRLLELEGYIHMPDGNLYRIEENTSAPDEDGSRYFKKQMMAVLIAPDKKGTSNKEAVINFLKEELEANRKAKAEQEDALDQAVISYDDWESNPQMSNYVDIPSTPTPRYIYAGNSRQMFYDFIPEDHPDFKRINTFLTMANGIDWDVFNDKTIEYFKGWLLDEKRYQWKDINAAHRLLKLCEDIANSSGASPEQLAINALRDIDDVWASGLRASIISKFFQEDPIIKDIRAFEELISSPTRQRKATWAEIGKLGRHLYSKYTDTCTTGHWNQYQKLKQKYAPEIRVGNIDVNRANYNQLYNFFKQKYNSEIENLRYNLDISEAATDFRLKKIYKQIHQATSWVFFNRPFISLEDLAKKNMILPADITATGQNSALISLIKKTYREASSFKDPGLLGKLAGQLINIQRNNPSLCSEQEWLLVWQTYRICKANLDS